MSAIRGRVQEAVDLTKLAHTVPRRTWAGHGTGAHCNLCGQPIQSDQIEYEVELSSDGIERVLYLHLRCYQEWALKGARPAPK